MSYEDVAVAMRECAKLIDEKLAAVKPEWHERFLIHHHNQHPSSEQGIQRLTQSVQQLNERLAALERRTPTQQEAAEQSEGIFAAVREYVDAVINKKLAASARVQSDDDEH